MCMGEVRTIAFFFELLSSKVQIIIIIIIDFPVQSWVVPLDGFLHDKPMSVSLK